MVYVFGQMKNLTLLVIVVYLLVIFYFSSIPVPKPLQNKPDILLHFLEYAGLGFLFYAYYSENFKKKIESGALLFSLIFIFLFAVSDEYHQSFIPGRVSDVKDVVVDFLGAFISLYFFSWINKKLSK